MNETGLVRTAANERGFARQLLGRRREQEVVLGKKYNAGSVWDLLLAIFSAEDPADLTVHSLAKAAMIAPTTTLRWISELERDGLLIRQPHPHDGRRVTLELNAQTELALRELLHSWMDDVGAEDNLVAGTSI